MVILRSEETFMTAIRVVAIPTQIADGVRASGKAPRYGHPAHTEIAAGFGPCRHCLRTFAVGAERRTLFTYDAFAGVASLPLPGPVFIHADGCERYPEDGGYPAQLRKYPTTFNAYGKGRRLVAQEYVADGNVSEAIEQLFLREDVDYIHARNTEAGCYGFRVERA
jgi:Protein of unknown function (DUF1203)